MWSFQRGAVPAGYRLILASGSPRRRELLTAAGYEFDVVEPHEGAECGICSRETPPQMVARLAFQKAKDVALRVELSMVLAADTVAECNGTILGKPRDRDHARQMLRMLRGRPHAVYTGVCLWQVPQQRVLVDVSASSLTMHSIPDDALEAYLDTQQWVGKAGAFGFQDGLDWIDLIAGTASNVVGLPMERLVELLRDFPDRAESVDLEKQPQ